MKSISIKTKVLIVLTVSLALGALVLVMLVRGSYQKNVSLVAKSALHSAQMTFDNLKNDRLSSLTLISASLANVDGVSELFAKRDRDALYAYLTPTFKELKAMGVPFIVFLETDGTVFLRMHEPKVFGDNIGSTSYIRQSIEAQKTVVGVDLNKPGFVTSSCRPYRDKSGTIIGYMIVAAAFDNFLAAMKSQTGDDFILIGHKKFLGEQVYRNSQKIKGRPDTWGQYPAVVVLGQTIETYDKDEYEKNLEGLGNEGKLLGQIAINKGVFISGVFPLYNSAGEAVGGIFVRRDITELQAGMQKVQITAVAAIVALMFILSFIIAIILNKLVFARLRHTMDVATRVVGGEFSSAIVPASDDEVGQLERLFEQFRTIFVGVVDELSSRQAEDNKKSA